MKYSPSEENYIKNIYHLQVPGQGVSATMLAANTHTKAASVTEMLKKLHRKKLINYKPYQNFTLTESGNRIALEIIRKHRLWEYFLVHKLGFQWDEVHEIAEELEHIRNKDLVQKLDQYLDFPSFDPHGDPIPDRNGKMKAIRQTCLADIPVKKTVTVNAITQQSTQMHQLMKHYGIAIGTRLKVNRHFAFDGSVEIKIDKLPPAVLSALLAKNIFCTI
ncbi:MAG: metal-dependent transcriptional regulator [Ferruginibacter sp.]